MAEQEEKGPIENPVECLLRWQATFGRIRQRFGVPRAVMLALLAVSGCIWWNYKDLARKPGAQMVLEHSPIIMRVTIVSPKLILLHKSLFDRAFVLIPLAEIAATLAGEAIEKWEDGA
jgi:hypothetical protein